MIPLCHFYLVQREAYTDLKKGLHPYVHIRHSAQSQSSSLFLQRMGNALYRRLSTRFDTTKANTETLPSCSSNNNNTTTCGQVDFAHHQQHHHHSTAFNTGAPQFKRRHASCSTSDDPAAPFFVVAQHQLLRQIAFVQVQFALFTLYLWNYLSSIRFMFGQDAYGTPISPYVYEAWMAAGSSSVMSDVHFVAAAGGGGGLLPPPSTKRWIALLYLACTVGGLVSAVFLVVAMFWENSAAAAGSEAEGEEQRRYGGGGVVHFTRRMASSFCSCVCSSRVPPTLRVFLQRPLFVYTPSRFGLEPRSESHLVLQTLDQHANFHEAFGDDYRGEVAPYLVYVAYVFVLPLAIIDMGVVSDLTLTAGGGGNSTTAGNVTATSSFGSAKIGQGLSVLQGVVLALGLLFVILPPRRWYQFKAEAYLARRYY